MIICRAEAGARRSQSRPQLGDDSLFGYDESGHGLLGKSVLRLRFLLFMQTSNGRGQSIREMNLFCCICESKTRLADLFAMSLNVCVKSCSVREIVDLGRIL